MIGIAQENQFPVPASPFDHIAFPMYVGKDTQKDKQEELKLSKPRLQGKC